MRLSILFVLLSSALYAASAFATDGLTLALKLYDDLRACNSRLGGFDFESSREIRSRASLTRFLDQNPRAIRLAGKVENPFGLTVVAIPQDEPEKGVTFVILRSMPARELTHFEHELARSYAQNMVGNALFPIEAPLAPNGPYRVRSSAVYDEESGAENAMIKSGFWLSVERIERGTYAEVVNSVLTWDETMRLRLGFGAR